MNCSDPYVKLRCGAQKFTSKVKRKTLNPVWEESFMFIISHPLTDSILLKVRDK